METTPALANNILGLGGVNANPPSLIIPSSNPEGYFSLHAHRGAAETNGARCFFKSGVVGQVPVGKIWRVVAVLWNADTVAEGRQLCYGTTETAGVPTGTVTYEFGATSRYGWVCLAPSTWYSMGYTFDFPAQSYPGMQGSTSPRHEMILICKEVAA